MKSLPGLFAALEAVSHALKHEKGLNKGIIEGLPTPFLLVDTKERAVFTNQACLDMVQIDGSPKKQLGRTLAEIVTIQHSLGRASCRGWIPAFAGMTCVSMPFPSHSCPRRRVSRPLLR